LIVTTNPSALPATTVAGNAQGFVVTIKDQFGNVVPGYTGTIHFTSSDPQAVLPADYTFTAADAGSHRFTATLKAAGNRAITATATGAASLSGTEGGIIVSPATVSTLSLAGFPTMTVAGSPHGFIVTAKDAYGNVATQYTGAVHLSSTDAAAALQGDYTFTASDKGSHTFAAALLTAGTQTIAVTDKGAPSLTSAEVGIAVSPAAASTLAFANLAPAAVAGGAQAITVITRDAYGNTATGYMGTVHFTSTDSQAVLASNYTFTASDKGVHTFITTLKTAGAQVIAAVDTATAGIAGAYASVIVSPAAASTLAFAGLPTTATAGSALAFTVTAKDAYGNTAAGYPGTVHFSSNDARTVLSSDYTFTAADKGTHAFSVTFKTPGSRAIAAVDVALASLFGGDSGITVQAATPNASAGNIAPPPPAPTGGTTASPTGTPSSPTNTAPPVSAPAPSSPVTSTPATPQAPTPTGGAQAGNKHHKIKQKQHRTHTPRVVHPRVTKVAVPHGPAKHR
jgi:hypothetical protein